MIDTEYKVNNGQKAKIHILLGQLQMPAEDLKEYKANLVRQFTDDRESSTTRLSWKEAKDMIAALEAAITNPADAKKEADRLKADRKRKRIIHHARLMGHEVAVDGKVKADMDWVNGWCEKHGYLHKPLNDYKVDELSKLVWQMEQAYKHYLKSV